ncbi:MAG: nuclear transport factor 2 family protein [Planctomycetes bacterium]|nr:nuclear transport factor 2 family protein [Planctomycetota bacterium]
MTVETAKTDREMILDHIHGLFKAFLSKDRETIRRGHTADWRGFQIRSRHLVRGIDEYMKVADQVMNSFPGTRYELIETDIEVHGDVAIVFYLAREWLPADDGPEKTILIRSVDIYRREPAGWNQCGSNICVVPDEDPAATDSPA